MKAEVLVRPAEKVKIPLKGDAPEELDPEIIVKWQGILDILARTAGIPAALLMRVREREIEVFAASSNDDNVYEKGATEGLGCGLYCETVVGRREGLLVPDALADRDWADNPDVALGMISYYGVPVAWPDGSIFGTLCILDRKENTYSETIRQLVEVFREAVEADLALQVQQAELRESDRLKAEFLAGARAVFECETFEDAARRLFDACSRAIGAVSGYVALLNRSGDENEVLFLESGGLTCEVDPSLSMPVRGLRAEAYERKEVVYDNHFMEGRWAELLPENHVMMTNVLFAPLIVGEKVEGLMGLANKPSDFTDRDAELATAFSNMAAVALRRNREVETMNSRLETIRAINRMTTSATSATELVERFIASMADSGDVAHAWALLLDADGKVDRDGGTAFTGEDFIEEGYLKEGKMPPCVEKMRRMGRGELELDPRGPEIIRGDRRIRPVTHKFCFELSHLEEPSLGYFGLALTAPEHRLEEDKRVYREIARDLSLALHGIRGRQREQKHLEALTEAKIAAEEANMAKSDFIAVMSHELRTPLNPVIGLSDLLMERSADPDTRNYAEIINTSGRHQLNLITDILDFCRIDKAEFKVEKKETNIVALLETVKDLLKTKVDRSKTCINLVATDDAPPVLRTDPVRLKQILMNLVGNAAKFTQEGFITLVCSREGDTCLIKVEDTGLGISEADQERIFEPFTQVEASVTRRYGGSGLGLTICRKLAGLLGGGLTLESTLGQGSCFTLRLPLERVETAPAGADGSSGGQPSAGRTVLVVEDDPASAKTLFFLLKKFKAEITVVHDGKGAIEACREKKFDIILLDIQLPDINGKEVCRTIRREQGNGPYIIAQTAVVLNEEEEKCRRAGVDAFLEKPIFARTLFAFMEEAEAALEDASTR